MDQSPDADVAGEHGAGQHQTGVDGNQGFHGIPAHHPA